MVVIKTMDQLVELEKQLRKEELSTILCVIDEAQGEEQRALFTQYVDAQVRKPMK